MKITIKSLFTILLSFAVIIGTASVVAAIEPRFSDTHSLRVSLTFDETTANCVADLIGANGTTSIYDGRLTLTDSSGNIKGDWKNLSSNNDSLYVSKSVSGLNSREEYTLTFSAKVKRNGNVEPVSDIKSKTCP